LLHLYFLKFYLHFSSAEPAFGGVAVAKKKKTALVLASMIVAALWLVNTKSTFHETDR
jgi:hypothetical protein